MPMYRGKPFQARFCHDENRADIAAWCGLDEDEVVEGCYYEEDGTEWDGDEFLLYYDEVE
ncbi:MAG: hypothetical protein C0436_00300 [Alphaproteobacteria bacterium]|nr:hypothetical protein [Alphaproteobacteria bacterium]